MRSEQTSAITISTKLFPTREKKSGGSSDVHTCVPPLRSTPLRSPPLPCPSRENDIYDGRPVPRCPQEVGSRRGNLLPSTEVSRPIPADADVPWKRSLPSCKFYSAVLSRPCNLRPPRKNGRSDGRPPFHSCARVYVDARMRACAKLSLDSFVRVGRTLCRIPALLYTYVREI